MSDTTDLMGVSADNSVDTAAPAEGAATGTTSRRRRSGTGLDGMVLAELQQVASGLGIRGTARMRKSQLIEVIKEAQGGGSPAPKTDGTAGGDAEAKPKRRATSKARTGDAAPAADAPADQAPAKAAKTEKADKADSSIDIPGQPASDDQPAGERRRRRATAQAGSPDTKTETRESGTDTVVDERPDAKAEAAVSASDRAEADGRRGDRQERGQRGERGERGDRQSRQRDRRGKGDDQQGGGGQQAGGQRQQRQGQSQGGQNQGNGPQDDFDDEAGGRRGRRGRYRDRRGRRGREEFGGGGEPQVADDDVLIPVAGILDILDNYAFIRTSGYLPGPNDVYVSLAQVRKSGLRKGDHL
ncbi:Rho termination factor N-terminal domain-containing protein, partial [Streptomyces niveus]